MIELVKEFAKWIVVAVVAALLWVTAQTQKPGPVGEVRDAQIAPEVSGIEKEEISPAKVKVLPKSAKRKMNLPSDVQANDALHVLDASSLPENDHPVVVTHILDAESGETRTLVEQKPYPLIQSESENEAIILAGVKNGGKKVLRFGVSADLVQIKAVHIGAHATMDTDGQYFAGGGLRIPLD